MFVGVCIKTAFTVKPHYLEDKLLFESAVEEAPQEVAREFDFQSDGRHYYFLNVHSW